MGVIETVLWSVFANVLTMFLTNPFQKIGKKQTNLSEILKDAIEGVAGKFEWEGTPRLEEVCLFLGLPEVESVVRQIFSVKISESNVKNIELITIPTPKDI